MQRLILLCVALLSLTGCSNPYRAPVGAKLVRVCDTETPDLYRDSQGYFLFDYSNGERIDVDPAYNLDDICPRLH